MCDKMNSLPGAVMFSLLVLYSFQLCFGFNLEIRIPIVKTGPADSHFGFSVALHKSLERTDHTFSSPKSELESWMLVGAPKGENLQPETNRSGALYKCPWTNSFKDCEQVLTDGLKDPHGPSLPPTDDEIKDDQWMGVTVKSQGEDGKILVCAHRYQRKDRSDKFRAGFGLCYLLSSTFTFEDRYEPCIGKQPLSLDYVTELSYCQAGTSGIILEDEILLGVPGTHNWTGTIYSLDLSSKNETQYFGVYMDDQSPPVDKYSYLGYSVAAGKFFEDKMSYVAGAPRAGGTGQVVFFNKLGVRNGIMPFNLILKGETFASRYGSEVIAMDINGDKKDDLIVSAPFYFTRFSSGAVYIYLNEGDGIKETTPNTRLEGPAGESRFGFSMTSLGDLNLDGYNDLAIGAPYDDKGAIYIYLGSKDGIQKKPSQIIRAEDLPNFPGEASGGSSYDAFGYALSGGLDLDGNGYNDLLTSSFGSDKVILLRARPIIDIVTKVTPTKLEIPTENGCDADTYSRDPCFSFKTCFKMMNQAGLSPSLHFKYNITERFYPDQLRSRIRFQNAHRNSPGTLENEVDLLPEDTGDDACTTEVVYLTRDQIDLVRPIRFKLTYEVVQKEPKFREGGAVPNIDDYPILNQDEAVKYFEATLPKDCGDDDICDNDLAVEATLDLPQVPDSNIYAFELGKKQFFNLDINVTNTGEPAYRPILYIAHDEAIDLRRTETEAASYQCVSTSNSLIHCTLDNPLMNRTDVLNLVFKVSGLTFKSKTILLDIWANSTSRDANPLNNRVSYSIDVKRRAEISITGSVEPEQVFYSGEVIGQSAIKKLEEIGTEVIHKYHVNNKGPLKVDKLHVNILWPYQVENHKKQGKWLLYLTDIPIVVGDGECDINLRLINPLNKETGDVKPEGTAARYVSVAVSPDGTTRTKRSKSSSTKKYISAKLKRFTRASSKKTIDGKVTEAESSQTFSQNGRGSQQEYQGGHESNPHPGYDDEGDYATYDDAFSNAKAERVRDSYGENSGVNSGRNKKIGTTITREESAYTKESYATNSKDNENMLRATNNIIRSIADFQIKREGEHFFVYGYDNDGNVVWTSRNKDLGSEDQTAGSRSDDGSRQVYTDSSYKSHTSSGVRSKDVSQSSLRFDRENINSIKNFEVVTRDGDSWIEGFNQSGQLVWSSRNRYPSGSSNRVEGDENLDSSVDDYAYKRIFSSKNAENTLTEIYIDLHGERRSTKSWSDNDRTKIRVPNDPNNERLDTHDHDRSSLSGSHKETRIRFDWIDPNSKYVKNWESSRTEDEGRWGNDNGFRKANYENTESTHDSSYRGSSSYHSGATYSRAVVDENGDAKVYSLRTASRNSDQLEDEIHGHYDVQWGIETDHYNRPHRRTKREEERIIKAETATDAQTGRTLKVVNFRCDGENPTAECYQFQCTIRNLDENQAATIHIKARLWNATLVEDYSHVHYVSIKSRAELILPEDIRDDQDTSDDVAAAETVAYSNLLDQPLQGDVPLWVILVSILAGLLLLVLIAVVLWKLGFFKRRRPDPALSDNLDNNGD